MKEVPCTYMQASSASYAITYKGGQVFGAVGSDVLSLTQSPITLMNQTFGLTDSGTLDFSHASCDGVFVRAPLLPAQLVVQLGVPEHG